jgi:hypothetical protein
MKTLTLTALAVLLSLFSFAQSNTQHELLTPQVSLVKNSQVSLSGDKAELASIEGFNNIGSAAFLSKNGDAPRCDRGKKLRTVGIVLSAVGGTLLIGGATMIGIAANSLANGTYVGDDASYVGLVGGGAACIVFGIASAGAGIPLAIIGSVKMKKYCGGSKESSLNLNAGKNGVGLAYKF